MTLRLILSICSLGLLIYLVLPGPSSIDSFPGLPGSLKSIEPGDTVQVSNVAAYYSQLYRNDVVSFYRTQYQNQTAEFLSPLRLNYPPEFAYTAIKDQTRSTYLEELVYPMRDSIFINGFEPFYEDNRPKYRGATDIIVDGAFFNTKTTLHYYGSPIWARVVVWAGINLAVFGLWIVGKKIFREA